MDRIGIRDLSFYAYHGALPEEKRLGQRFFVDLDLFLSLEEAGREDALEKTIHYGEVCALIEERMKDTRHLIEAVAEDIARTLLASYPRLEGLLVTVKKPQAPISQSFGRVEVSLERWRHE